MSRQSVGFVVQRAATAVAGLSLILQLGSCSRGNGVAEAQAQGGRGGGRGDASAVPVTTARVVEKAVPVDVTTIGTGEALSTVEVRAQVAGPLTSVQFTEGQDVEKGQLLFTIDPRPFDVAVQQAEAALAKDEAQAKGTEQIRARNEDLFKRELLARSDYEASVTAATGAAAMVQVDKAALETAKLQLQYTKILAPISGRTGALLVHQGSLVRSTDTTPLVVINQIAPIRVAFAVPGQYLATIRANQAKSPLLAQARMPGGTSAASSGAVSFIDNTIDTTTGTIKLKATFPNTNHELWPGALVETRLRLSVDPHALVVPAGAVQNGQQGQYVFVVGSDRTVSMRPVTVARTSGDDAVVSTGLKTGEEVVTDGQLRLVPGARIAVKGADKSGS
ncbi:MAG TPA: efflux RND transporter periplasmic adaptor subunit [Vicinamibacterales bacterium]|nr:efflux RND transporter periplasmic adaptor subunit [Vicinamibacterales bacterium]